jgi:glycosyltransferase involved in cell wall biosynthesis
MPSHPRVSIGLPVYNGENYVTEAIESLLGQTFTDLELIICDNASTDRTEEICRGYAATDGRVRYQRNSTNLGHAPNFNRTFELARGEYFKHAGHDDIVEPTFLERCVGRLDAHPDAVLCHCLTRVRTAADDGLVEPLKGLDDADRVRRFAAVVLLSHWTAEVHGVIRAEALRRTRRLQPYFGADRALFAEIVLQGRALRVEEPLFINRDHPGRTMRALSFADRLRFHDPDRRRGKILPQWALYKDYLQAVDTHVRDPRERRRCRVVLARWWVINWNAARAGLDLVAAIAPGVSDLAFRLRERYHSAGIGVR